MSFQIGIGDVVLLAQLSIRLIQALSSGRKSAPAQLRGIEHHLSLLITALEAAGDLHRALKDDKEQRKLAASLETAVERCRSTLNHLESTIAKYRTINDPAVLPQSAFDRLNDSLSRNWKKVEWTTEKGNLQSIREDIMQHTSTINLVIVMSIHVQTRDVNSILTRVDEKTEDLHDWYAKNLARIATEKSKLPRDAAQDNSPSSSIPSATEPRTFELSVPGASPIKILCANSVISDAWLEEVSAHPTELPNIPLFTCWCRTYDGPLAPDHSRTMEAFVVSSSTFPVREAGRGHAWQLLRVADRHVDTFVTLRIDRVHPKYTATLQRRIMDPLALSQSNRILETGRGNSLAYISSTNTARILASISSLRRSSDSVMSVKITANHRSVVSETIADIQILRYQGITKYGAVDSGLGYYLVSESAADVSISYQVQEDLEDSKQIVRTNLIMQHTTKSELELADAAVSIYSINLVSEYADGREIYVPNTTTTIYFATTDAAKEFRDALANMRFELFVHSLQYPRLVEKIVASIPASQIEVHGDTSATYIDDGLVSIFRSDTEPGELSTNHGSGHRLVVASTAGNIVLSQELPTQLSSTRAVVSSEPSGMAAGDDATTPTPRVFVAQIGPDGMWRLHSPQKGFKSITFTSEQGRRETLEIDSTAEVLPGAPHQIPLTTLPHRITL